MAEQHAGRSIADVLTLHTSPEPPEPPWVPPDTGGLAVAEAPPRVRRKLTVEPTALARRRSLAIRHVSGHRLVALVEIVSPANKDRFRHVEELVDKVVSALERGVHVLLVDLFPPGPHDACGLHGLILQSLEQSDALYDWPAEEPLTLASYAAGPGVDIYLEHLPVGSPLAEMPLFLRPDRYVNVPLDQLIRPATGACQHFGGRSLRDGRSGQKDRPVTIEDHRIAAITLPIQNGASSWTSAGSSSSGVNRLPL